jgi:hypothetical protein
LLSEDAFNTQLGKIGISLKEVEKVTPQLMQMYRLKFIDQSSKGESFALAIRFG